MDWHSMSVNEVLRNLRTNIDLGLSEDEVKNRLLRYGKNELVGKGKSLIKLFIKQFTNFLIIILIVSAIIAWVLGEVTDASAIIFIVIIMGIAGFLQEFRAEKAVEALKKMATPKAKVVRNGKVVEVPATEVVPGDIVLLNEGDRVPADLRLVRATELLIDESPLTGESVPVRKDPEKVLPASTPITERVNMAFMGTHVVSGKGVGVVVATGMNTVLGSIAKSVSEVEERRTLLEEELDRLGRRLGGIILGISAVVFILSTTLGGMSLIDSLILSIALAVAAIPEGLPAVATSVLAIGAYRMSKRNVIVRELGAIESLGACDVIASDKTGTITKGEMTVKQAWIGGVRYEVEGIGYEPKGRVRPLSNYAGWEKLLLKIAELIFIHVGDDASIVKENNAWIVKGSPTEGAALVFAYKAFSTLGVKPKKEFETVKVYPFDRFRKRKTTIHKLRRGYIAVVSGAPEILLELASKVLTPNGESQLTDSLRKRLINYISSTASEGYRTYGVAYRYIENPSLSINDLEKNLTFAALLSIIDPPREGVREAVNDVRKAGVKVIMITGDHKLTAKSVAKMIGLDVEGEGKVLEGKDLDSMSDKELRKAVEKATVFARVTPEHKRRIVEALRTNGHVVAMTGDGVNDAPALKEADIGIAMGVRGTDVAREVAKLILKDDNFVSIVAAIKEGRVIYENLKKPINYLLPANIGEVATIFLAELAGLPPPLDAPQLLWINVTTDSLPALALSVEPAEPDIMSRPPRKRKGGFITGRKLTYFSILGSIIGLVNIALFKTLLPLIGIVGARTVAFTAIAFSEFGRALTSRSEERHFWFKPFNKWLIPALGVSALLQLTAVYVPLMNKFFTTSPISPSMLLLATITAIPILVIDEVRKSLRIKLS